MEGAGGLEQLRPPKQSQRVFQFLLRAMTHHQLRLFQGEYSAVVVIVLQRAVHHVGHHLALDPPSCQIRYLHQLEEKLLRQEGSVRRVITPHHCFVHRAGWWLHSMAAGRRRLAGRRAHKLLALHDGPPKTLEVVAVDLARLRGPVQDDEVPVGGLQGAEGCAAKIRSARGELRLAPPERPSGAGAKARSLPLRLATCAPGGVARAGCCRPQAAPSRSQVFSFPCPERKGPGTTCV